jgi:hypothetical protein
MLPAIPPIAVPAPGTTEPTKLPKPPPIIEPIEPPIALASPEATDIPKSAADRAAPRSGIFFNAPLLFDNIPPPLLAADSAVATPLVLSPDNKSDIKFCFGVLGDSGILGSIGGCLLLNQFDALDDILVDLLFLKSLNASIAPDNNPFPEGLVELTDAICLPLYLPVTKAFVTSVN